MRLTQMIADALSNVGRGKLRTALTILGLVVGISSVIILVGLSDGSNRAVEEQMEALGGDAISAYLMDKSLAHEDVRQIGALEALDSAAPSLGIAVKVSAGKQISKKAMVEATDERYLRARTIELARGRNLTSVDRANRSKVCVLGEDVAKELFGRSDIVGNTVELNGDTFTVVGVLQSKGELAGVLTNSLVVVPLSLTHEFGVKEEITSFYARAKDRDKVAEAKQAITEYLRDTKQIAPQNIQVNTQDEMLGAEDAIDEALTLLLGGIASISLVVAGIGVMNIMLVSISERIREIGTRKAFGARRCDILAQFLIEALVISLIGGICGVLVGLLFGAAASSINMRFEASAGIIALAAAASITIGLVFGALPACRASRLDPIEALRRE